MTDVLIVDDDADVRIALVDALVDEGVSAIGASTGKQALELLASGTLPRLIIVDWNMAPMTGSELIERLRTSPFSTIPVALLTADDRADNVSSGTVATLKKPIPLETLLNFVSGHCGTTH